MAFLRGHCRAFREKERANYGHRHVGSSLGPCVCVQECEQYVGVCYMDVCIQQYITHVNVHSSMYAFTFVPMQRACLCGNVCICVRT